MSLNPYRELTEDETIALLDTPMAHDYTLAALVRGDTPATGVPKIDVVATIVKRADELRQPKPDTRSVEDYVPATLIKFAIRTAGRGKPPQVRWAHVGQVFGLGSTYATQLCRMYGFDPEEVIGDKQHDAWDYRTNEERIADGDAPFDE